MRASGSRSSPAAAAPPAARCRACRRRLNRGEGERMNAPMKSRYREVYTGWKADPERFWAETALEIDWAKPAQKVFDPKAGIYGRWFVGAECNACYNAVDRHVAGGRAEQAAIVYDSPVTRTKRILTYRELQEETAALGAVLRDMGVGKGDRVILYMPMIPEAAIAMLACARIGAIHSVVFGGFAARELATRIDDAQPKVILSASCGIEAARVIPYKPLLDHAIELALYKPERVVMLQRPQVAARLTAPRDVDWQDALEGATPVPCVPVAATDTLY